MQEAQRFFLLTQIDNIWKEHLQAMNFLRSAVGLRGAPRARTWLCRAIELPDARGPAAISPTRRPP